MVKGHDKNVNVLTQSVGCSHCGSVTAVDSYACLKPGLGKIPVSLCSLTSRSMYLKLKTVIAKVATANTVPTMLAQKYAEIKDGDAGMGSAMIDKDLNGDESSIQQPKLTPKHLEKNRFE